MIPVSHRKLLTDKEAGNKLDLSVYRYVCTSSVLPGANFSQDIYYSDNINKNYNSHYVGLYKFNNSIICTTNADIIEKHNFILLKKNNLFVYSQHIQDVIEVNGVKLTRGRLLCWDDISHVKDLILTKIKSGVILPQS